jgi:hypothetical protein
MKGDVLAAPPLRGGAAGGGGQPAGLAAAPTKYHRLAFGNFLHRIGLRREGSEADAIYRGGAMEGYGRVRGSGGDL